MAARQRDDDAIVEFRRALPSSAGGDSRTNFELGRVLMRRGRPADAIAAATPALRGPVEATGFYVTHVEVHELVAQGWDSLGATAAAALPPGESRAAAVDSAVAHYRWVARAWKNGDPAFAARAERAAGRMRGLGR